MKYKLKDLEVNIQELDNIGDIMSIEEFISHIISRTLIDYDGFVKFIIEEDDKKYEIVDISYSIDKDEVYYFEDGTYCSLIQFCRYYEIKKVVWYNK